MKIWRSTIKRCGLVHTRLEILFLAGVLMTLAFLVNAVLFWMFHNNTGATFVVTARPGIILGPRYNANCKHKENFLCDVRTSQFPAG
jgi:hypothetical protein